MKGYLVKVTPALSLFGLMLVVFWPVLSGGAFLNTGVIYSDMWLFNYPLKDFYREQLVSGKLPFWTSLVGNGYPVFAEGQVGALYPLHLLLFAWLPTLLAFNLNIFLHFFLAAVLTYAFCRISLKLSGLASVLASVVYSLSGFFVTHFHQINILMVISYLPLVFLVVERIGTTKRSIWAFILALIFALQIFAGYIEMFYYSSILGFAFMVLITFLFAKKTSRKERGEWKVLVLFSVAAILGAGISLVQILPTWELTKFSQRAEGLSIETASATVWPFETLSLFINPLAYDLYRTEPGYHPLTSTTVNVMALYGYVGILTLLLALLAIVFKRERFVVIFTIFLVGSFVYGLGRSTQLFAILREVVPGLKFFRYPVKILFFIEFGLGILAGFGLDFVVKKLSDLKLNKTMIGVVSFSLVGLIFGDLVFNNVVRRRIIIPGDEWLSTPEAVKFLQEELGDFNLHRVYSHGTNNLDYQMARNYKMQKELRNILHVDFNLIYRIPENREWFGLFLERQTNLNKERTSLDPDRGVLGLSDSFKRSLALQSVKFLVADLPIEDPDLVLVKEIDFSQEIDHYAYLMGTGGPVTVTVPAKATYIYEYTKAFPRASFVADARVVESGAQALELVLSGGFDPSKEVILEEVGGLKASNAVSGENRVQIVEDAQLEMGVVVEADADGYLVLADTYYPGWKAYVDGKEARIYRANYAFRAVPLEAGEHLVKFSYIPTHWRLGFLISAASLLFTVIGLGYALVTGLDPVNRSR